LVKLKDAAARLGISIRTLYRMIEEGLLPRPVLVTGKSRALCESDLDAFIERLKRDRGR